MTKNKGERYNLEAKHSRGRRVERRKAERAAPDSAEQKRQRDLAREIAGLPKKKA